MIFRVTLVRLEIKGRDNFPKMIIQRSNDLQTNRKAYQVLFEKIGPNSSGDLHEESPIEKISGKIPYRKLIFRKTLFNRLLLSIMFAERFIFLRKETMLMKKNRFGQKVN